MRRHAHDSAVAVTHQHIVANPHLDLLTRQRVGHEEPGALALFLLRGEFCLGGAAGLALFQKSRQLRVAGRRMQRQRMLGRHGAKGHAHDGVGARREHKHAAVADQRARGVFDFVRERKAHTFALADPVFLHQAHALGPALERGLVIADLHMVQQLLCVVGDLEVIARDLALFNHRAGAPALAVDHLLIGQHGLVHRVPVDDLRLAIRDALFQHLQKQPLVPLVIRRVAGGDLAAPVDGQAQGLHLLLHVSDVLVGPLGRRHAVFQGGVFGRQTKGVPTHGHQHVVALHAQVAREHVVDGVVAHMAHVQLAAGVGQHGAGVVLALGLQVGRVFADAVSVSSTPVSLRVALDVKVLVFVLHGETGKIKRAEKISTVLSGRALPGAGRR